MLVLNYVKMDPLTNIMILKDEAAGVIALIFLSAVVINFVPRVMVMPTLVMYLAKTLACVAAVLAQTMVWLLTFLILSVLKVIGMGLFLCCWNLYLFY